jgi:DNA-binding NtrC family response regulator
MKSGSILIVEDDAACAQYMSLALCGDFHDVLSASSGTSALLALESEAADLVLLDKGLPDIDGLELLTLIKERWPELPVIFITAASDVATVVEAVRRGAANFLVKPVGPAALLAAARASARSPQETPRPEGSMTEFVGISRAAVQVRHLVTLASRCNASVLLTGETGTGKELAARAIHRLSALRDRPFVAHNCATTPADLFDSEMFGHVRGAFTGADRDHAGLLSRACGGVLFLDELESLGLCQQAKLLRVLDDGEMKPVGSSETQVVCVRFVSATNRGPQEMMGEGTLRQDLYYRLAGFEIRLPPLRERLEDVPVLAAHFLGDSALRLAPPALELLCRLPWPGNVRQLRNVLARASAVVHDGEIEAHHVNLDLTASPHAPFLPGSHTATLKELEAEAILRALKESGGNRGRAARTLGIDRSTLRRKIQDLDLRL